MDMSFGDNNILTYTSISNFCVLILSRYYLQLHLFFAESVLFSIVDFALDVVAWKELSLQKLAMKINVICVEFKNFKLTVN